jgi:hypothetical protein
MADNPARLPTQESEGAIHVKPQKHRTWFPILFGVLCGMIAWCLLGMIESPSFYRLTVWIFKETSPKALFAMPAYYCVHRTLLLAMAAVGGSVGVLFSHWHKGKSVLFLLATLCVIAVFAALGFH